MLLNKPKFDLCIAVLGKKPKNRHSIAKNELFRNKPNENYDVIMRCLTLGMGGGLADGIKEKLAELRI